VEVSSVAMEVEPNFDDIKDPTVDFEILERLGKGYALHCECFSVLSCRFAIHQKFGLTNFIQVVWFRVQGIV
jgi:hypothetical protein